jgi:ribosomal protein S1
MLLQNDKAAITLAIYANLCPFNTLLKRVDRVQSFSSNTRDFHFPSRFRLEENSVSDAVSDTPTETGETVESNAPLTLETLQPRMATSGKVTKVELGGVYVDIGVGTDGFAHISQLLTNTGEAVTRVADAFKPGDEVAVFVARVTPERRRIDLTMKKPAAFDWSNLTVGAKLSDVKVVAVESFGAFVNFDGPKDGLIPFNLMPKGMRPKIGDVIETVWVIEVNQSKNRVGMTMSEPPALPWESIHRGQEYKGRVTHFERNGAYIDIGAEREGLIRPSAIGAGYVDMRTVVSEGEEVTVKVLKVDPSRKIIDLTLPGVDPEEFALSSGPEETVSPFAAALMRAQKQAKRAAAPADAPAAKKPNPANDLLDRTLQSMQDAKK